MGPELSPSSTGADDFDDEPSQSEVLEGIDVELSQITSALEGSDSNLLQTLGTSTGVMDPRVSQTASDTERVDAEVIQTATDTGREETDAHLTTTATCRPAEETKLQPSEISEVTEEQQDSEKTVRSSSESGTMAEAHAAVAFSFTVTHEGVNLNVDREALYHILESGKLSWKKRILRLKNNFHNGVYPASLLSLVFTFVMVVSLNMANTDISFGLIKFIQTHVPLLGSADSMPCYIGACALCSLVLWLLIILVFRTALKLLLSYHGWIYDKHGKMSTKTKIWLGLVKLCGGYKPLLNSYQASLPKLFVPTLSETMERYLRSVRPLMNGEQYARMEGLAKEFQNTLGRKLQFYLILKSWWATNYVSDWWEDYVYLYGRSPIMINSNYYGIDAVLVRPSCTQTARAANIIYAMLQYRRELNSQQLNPILLNKTVPLCSAQYERQFNTTRIPGVENDTLVHHQDSNHIAVYHKGRYFKVYIRHKGVLLSACEIEIMLNKILEDTSAPAAGEEHLAALTAGKREDWANARTAFFAKGKNKASLDAIEKAAFVVALDDDPQDYDKADPDKLDQYGHAMLHGKGHDRWFDKSFTLVVLPNGRIGFNAEHSWADAPIMAHLWEYAISEDCTRMGYTPEGTCLGVPRHQPPNPIRLDWDLPQPCQQQIETSLSVAKQLIDDVDLHIMMYDVYGKGFIKKCRVSPDAYIQLALQLAYRRNAGKFCLTYESSMTRLFREGRTETVRSCTLESCEFVNSMNDSSKTNQERIKLMQQAAEKHQEGYKDAMTGRGIDRHLFCLYVVSKYLNQDSAFLKEVLSEPWRLSTSQTPHQQTDRLDLNKYPQHLCGGGGFGPVADDGYGVSYIIAGEDVIFFHISCKKSCPLTDARRFGREIRQALADMRDLFSSR